MSSWLNNEALSAGSKAGTLGVKLIIHHSSLPVCFLTEVGLTYKVVLFQVQSTVLPSCTCAYCVSQALPFQGTAILSIVPCAARWALVVRFMYSVCIS